MPTVPVLAFILMKPEVLSPDGQHGDPCLVSRSSRQPKGKFKSKGFKGTLGCMSSKADVLGKRGLNSDKGNDHVSFVKKKNNKTPQTSQCLQWSLCCLWHFCLGWDGHGDLKQVAGPFAVRVSQPHHRSGAVVCCPVASSAQRGTLAETFNVTSTVLAGA